MVSIYDVVWQKCNFKKAGSSIVNKFEVSADKRLNRISPSHCIGECFIEVALRLLFLSRHKIDEAFSMIMPSENTNDMQVVLKKSSKVTDYEMMQIVCKYGYYISSVHRDVLDYNFYLEDIDKTNFRKISESINLCISQLKILEKIVGSQIEEICNYNEAYNDIVSSSFTKFPVVLCGDTLCVLTSRFASKWEAVTVLMSYVLGMHTNNLKYKEIKMLCIFCVTRGEILFLPVKKISLITLKNISTNYIGYESDGTNDWQRYGGTNASVYTEILDYNRDKLSPEIIRKFHNKKIVNDYKKLEVNNDDALDDSIKSLSTLDTTIQAFAPGRNFGLSDFNVYYISDIHLEHHIKEEFFESEEMLGQAIQDIVQNIFSKDLLKQIKEAQNDYFILFLGDTANTISLSKRFYVEFISQLHKMSKDSKTGKVYAVVGNHELSEFDTLNEGLKEYENMFQMLGITLLNNDYEVISIGNHASNIAVCGGVGFAQYNEKYNSLTQVGPSDMDRKRDEEEGRLLANAQKRALEDPSAFGHPVIMASHYPVNDWLIEKELSSRCIYFNGHNHNNTRIVSESRNIYADNQVGYKRSKIKFKTVKFGPIYNPYADCNDGCYEVSLNSYEQFCEFCDDPIDGTYFLKQKLEKNDAHFFMLKLSGYYAFFIIDNKFSAICRGGKYTVLPKKNDIYYYYNNFGKILSAYLYFLSPIRKFEEILSEEIKSIGLSGRIHGNIIDVDFFNHIMINSLDGKITLYYSPEFGVVKEYSTFNEMLASMQNVGISLYERALEDYNKKKQINELTVLSKIGNAEVYKDFCKIDTDKNSIYGISNEMRNLERIFTSHVLREWDENIVSFSKKLNHKQRIRE